MGVRFQTKQLMAVLAGLALTAAAPGAALAVVLPPATATFWDDGSVYQPPESVAIPNTIVAGGPFGNVTVSLTTDAADGPSVSVIAGPRTSGYVDLTYYYQVTGPPGVPPGTIEPLDLMGSLVTTGVTTGSYSVAEIRAGTAGASACTGVFSSCYVAGALYPTVDFDLHLEAPVGTIEQISISAYAEGGQINTFAAYADPLLTVDPSAGGGNPGEFHILVSPGVYNGPTAPLGAVPEPTSWALMIMGFGVAGGALRLTRKRFFEKRWCAGSGACACPAR